MIHLKTLSSLRRFWLCLLVFLISPFSTAVRGQDVFIRGNANGDAKLDLADPIFTLYYLFLGGNPPLPPFPGCGEDLDDLDCRRFPACG